MTKPQTSRKVLLMLQQRDAQDSAEPPVRRYRLARLRFDGRAEGEGSRFAHLKRVYD